MSNHYRVHSDAVGESCIVFNAQDEEEARCEALNQYLGERLDFLFHGDASSCEEYDGDNDLQITLLCDSNVVKAINVGSALFV